MSHPSANVMPRCSSKAVFAVVPLMPAGQLHTHSHTLEGRAHLKQQIKFNHVMVGINCHYHFGGFLFIHFFSACQCGFGSRQSTDDCDDIVEEIKNELLRPIEDHFANAGFGLIPVRDLQTLISNEIKAYTMLAPAASGCDFKNLRMTNLSLAVEEVQKHAAECCAGAEGFLYSPTPLVVPCIGNRAVTFNNENVLF